MNKTFAIIAFVICGLSQVRGDNLVSNPGFETGDLTGWALSGTDSSGADNGIYYGVDAIDAHSGTYGAYFGPVGGVLDITQALTTTPGASYTVSFWLAQAPATPSPYINSVAVLFGGSTLFSQTDLGASGYSLYSFTGTAASASTSLQFAFRDDTGFFSLDDITVSSSGSAVPEPASILLACLFGAIALAFCVRKRRRPGFLSAISEHK